jgi:predicted RNA methylase
LPVLHLGDPELARILDEARLKLARTLDREQGGSIRADVTPRAPLPVLAHCRHGLSRLLTDELADFAARARDDETVTLTLRAPLSSLFRARTMLRFGFPLPVPRDADPGDAVVTALTSDAAWAIFTQLSDGPIRYRIEWAHAGHRRGLTFRCAAAIARARPALVNDPTASLWEAIVRESDPDQRHSSVSVELWPRGLPDPRFAYRRAHVPASSHPTLAAALARVAGAHADDVVWDPFVGAGTELIERARRGPFRRLYGSDADGRALELARQNLAAAAVAAELTVADARSFTPPEPPTLIITNPPMGRRVLDRHATGALYRDFLAHAARLLPSGGRLVWISPRGDETLALAEPLGLRCGLRQRIDMAGFWGELQAFTRGSRVAARFATARPRATGQMQGPPRSRKTRR